MEKLIWSAAAPPYNHDIEAFAGAIGRFRISAYSIEAGNIDLTRNPNPRKPFSVSLSWRGIPIANEGGGYQFKTVAAARKMANKIWQSQKLTPSTC